jgi:hypothetical protein
LIGVGLDENIKVYYKSMTTFETINNAFKFVKMATDRSKHLSNPKVLSPVSIGITASQNGKSTQIELVFVLKFFTSPKSGDRTLRLHSLPVTNPIIPLGLLTDIDKQTGETVILIPTVAKKLDGLFASGTLTITDGGPNKEDDLGFFRKLTATGHRITGRGVRYASDPMLTHVMMIGDKEFKQLSGELFPSSRLDTDGCPVGLIPYKFVLNGELDQKSDLLRKEMKSIPGTSYYKDGFDYNDFIHGCLLRCGDPLHPHPAKVVMSGVTTGTLLSAEGYKTYVHYTDPIEMDNCLLRYTKTYLRGDELRNLLSPFGGHFFVIPNEGFSDRFYESVLIALTNFRTLVRQPNWEVNDRFLLLSIFREILSDMVDEALYRQISSSIKGNSEGFEEIRQTIATIVPIHYESVSGITDKEEVRDAVYQPMSSLEIALVIHLLGTRGHELLQRLQQQFQQKQKPQIRGHVPLTFRSEKGNVAVIILNPDGTVEPLPILSECQSFILLQRSHVKDFPANYETVFCFDPTLRVETVFDRGNHGPLIDTLIGLKKRVEQSGTNGGEETLKSLEAFVGGNEAPLFDLFEIGFSRRPQVKGRLGLYLMASYQRLVESRVNPFFQAGEFKFALGALDPGEITEIHRELKSVFSDRKLEMIVRLKHLDSDVYLQIYSQVIVKSLVSFIKSSKRKPELLAFLKLLFAPLKGV